MAIYDVVIVGAGLGGLTAAVEAAKAGKTVLVIERRQEQYAAIRPQLIAIDSKTEKYLKSIYQASDGNVTNQILFERLAARHHFSIKDIQRYLMHHLDRKYASIRYASAVSEVNLDKGCLVVENVNDPEQKEIISFKDLVIADGCNSHTANLLKSHNNYVPLAGRREKNNVMGYFTIERIGHFPIENPIDSKTISPVILDDDCGVIYHEYISVKYPTKLKVCIVMNVSSQQFAKYKADKELGIRFLTHCLAAIFKEADCKISMTKSVKSGNEKDKLKYSTFTLDFVKAEQSAFEYNGHTVILVGDARRSPDFYQGHGGNDAILDGQLAAGIVNKEVNMDEYNNFCNVRSDAISAKTAACKSLVAGYRKKADWKKFIVPTFTDAALATTEASSPSTTNGLGLFSSNAQPISTANSTRPSGPGN